MFRFFIFLGFVVRRSPLMGISTLHDRGGFSKIMVVLTIVAIVVCALVGLGVLTVAAQKAREAANRISCVNNLRNIGIACHVYNDSVGHLPCEVPGTPIASGKGLFFDLAGFLEISDPEFSMNNQTAYKIFLCPSRHSAAVGPYVDYGYVKTDDPGFDAIFFPGSKQPYSLKALTEKGGTAYAVMLSHVGLKPADYTNPGATLKKWYGGPHYVSGAGSGFLQDNSNLPPGAIASPHSGSVPTLFADAHVSNIPVGWGPIPSAKLFDINNMGDKSLPPLP
jgi:prepilin-type processing-associated H-X9-DG protein